MKAYLLAAGYATRMYPLTKDQPKPLLDVGGVPVLTQLVRQIESIPDLTEVVVIGNHRFAGHFTRWRDVTPCTVPVRVLDDGSTNEDDRLGAIGDLAFALREVPPGNEDWLVAAGDNLLRTDLHAVHARFVEHRDPLLIVREVERTDGRDGPSPYNEVTLDEDGRVQRFREKPREHRTGLAAIAVYVFPPSTAGALGAYLEAGGNPDAPGHFIAWLVEQVTVRATRLDGAWFDIGSFETLEDARRRWGGP